MVRGALILPLLMVKESFKSLDNMTLEDYMTFIPFMTECAKKPTDSGVPVWWLNSVKYSFPLMKPYGMDSQKFRRILRSIVFQCYSYHNEDCTLKLCANLSKNAKLLKKKDNGDNTSSVCFGEKLVVRMRNLNWSYDATPSTSRLATILKSPRRQLLPVRQITNVYLCDNCDAEFTCQREITAHERGCYGWTESVAPQLTPPDLMGYLQLSDGNTAKTVAKSTPPKTSLIQNRFIEFSSDLGRQILRNNFVKDVSLNPLRLIQQYELFCTANLRVLKSRESYQLRALNRKKGASSEHSHPYCFTRFEKVERYKTLKTGLNARSRALLRKVKKCSVRVEKIVVPRPVKPPEPILIDLCSDDEF